MKNNITEPKKQKKLMEWQSKFQTAKNAYQPVVAEMNDNNARYEGGREVNVNPNKGKGKAQKLSTNVRNITNELIETQVDSTIPMPKVTAIHEEDTELARIIEIALENEIRLLHFADMNDESERVTKINGSDFYHVEWDNSKGFHCNIGSISVSEVQPRYIIPQPGVKKIEEMDYIFVLVPQTKSFIKRKYGIDVADAEDTLKDIREGASYDNPEDKQADSDIVTVIKCYYRNDEGEIGLFSWVDDFVLEDMKNYQARHLERCKECGRVKTSDVCECGSKKFEKRAETEEEIYEDIQMRDGSILSAVLQNEKVVTDEEGNPLLDILGNVVTEIEEKRTKIPYYKPNCIPLVMRKNITNANRLLGYSDAKTIMDQQDTVSKLGSKMNEKILKGGSIVTLPESSKIVTTDEELKIVRLKNPSEKNLIDVLNIQADISYDRIMLEENYNWAKSTLGITDAYQGKYDASAKSGAAKQYSINQAAGRLESKRVMKNSAYSRLYEMMFKFMLAYADQPIPISKKDNKGKMEYTHFNRYDFLKRDSAGELYWADEFIFETDPTSTIMMNREALWNQIDVKYQAGAFGPIGEPETLLTLWTFLARNDYPGANEMKDIFANKVREQQEQLQLAMAQQMQMQNVQNGGMTNEMPIM